MDYTTSSMKSAALAATRKRCRMRFGSREQGLFARLVVPIQNPSALAGVNTCNTTTLPALSKIRS